VQDSKSYYVTIKELNKMATTLIPSACAWLERSARLDQALSTRGLRFEGNELTLPSYTERSAPDTFKDDSQAWPMQLWPRRHIPRQDAAS